MQIRQLDWATALPCDQHPDCYGVVQHPDSAAPCLEAGAMYDVIIGSDLLYEVSPSLPRTS